MVSLYRRIVSLFVLGSGLAAIVTACNVDPEATITPTSGTWTSAIIEEIPNDCNQDVTVMPLLASTTLFIDHDGGDTFQIELGQNDLACNIDDADFSCSEYEVSTFEVGGLDATLRWVERLEGTLESSTRAEGHERIDVSCAGADCGLVDGVPCQLEWRFEMSAI